MHRYWARIAFGALLVFCLGMAGLTAVRKGKEQVGHLLASAATKLPLRLANIGFRFEGRRIGELTALDLVRKSSDELGRLTGHVELGDAAAVATLGDCPLTLHGTRRWSERTSFACATRSELDSGELVEVGTMVFQPGGFSRTLYLPVEVVADWKHAGIERLDASLSRDDHGGMKASGSFGLLSRRSGTRSGSFDLRADSGGALLSVRDEHNRPIVDLQATSTGFHLNISDKHGRNLLRLLADSLGAALKIRDWGLGARELPSNQDGPSLAPSP